jgi:hypothetical protein
MRKTIILLFTLSIFLSCEKKLTCEDFIEGEFISTTSAFPGVEWKTIMTVTKQIDFDPIIPQEHANSAISTDTTFANIKRIDNCTYQYFFDETNTDFPEYLKELNKSGWLIEKKKIEGKCFYFTMKSVTRDGEHIIEGKMCKID